MSLKTYKFDKELASVILHDAIDGFLDCFVEDGSTPSARTLVAWTQSDYAPNAYGSFAVGITRGGFVVTKDCEEISFHVTGRQKPDGIGTPGQVAEQNGSPYELVMNVEVWDNGRTTKLAGPFQVKWGGKRLLTTAPGQVYQSDFIPGSYAKGVRLEYQALVSRIASTGQTIAGEPGAMASTATHWPRCEGIGGGLGTYGIYGTKFTTSTSTSLPDWVTALDANNFPSVPSDASTSLNQGGFSPIAVTGKPTSSAGRISILDINDSTCRSGDANNRNRLDSGTGYLRSASVGEIGGFQWSVSGQKISDVIVNGNVLLRDSFTQYAKGAIIGLSSNDLKDGSVAAAETSLRTLISQLTTKGITWIAVQNCLYRWQTADAWKSYAGQSEQLSGFNAKALAWDAVLSGLLTEGLIDSVIDRRSLVQDPAQGFKWRLPVLVTSFNCIAGSTYGNPKSTGTGWTTDTFTNRSVTYGVNATYYDLFGNSSTQLNASIVNGPPNPGDPLTTGTLVEVWDLTTKDGVHPAPYGNYLIAQGLNPPLLNP